MDQVSAQHVSRTYTAFHVDLVCETLVFLLVATLHTGALGVPQLLPAMIVEGLCGAGCLLSVYAVFTSKRWTRKNVITTQILVLVAVLVGVLSVISNASIRTPLNLGLHGLMLVCILLALILFAFPATRVAFSSENAIR